MSRLSASGVPLARHCVAPFAPDAGQPNSATSKAGTAGTADHAAIESTIDDAEAEAEEARERGHIRSTFAGDITPKSDTHRRWLLDFWEHEKHLEWRAEEAFAVNPHTGETLAAPANAPQRDYDWAPWGFVPGTLDGRAFGPVPGHEIALRICDWKTGQARSVGPAKTSGQLFKLGLSVSRHIGWRGPVSLEYVRVNGDRCYIDRAVVTRADLLAFQGELARIMDASNASPAPTRGFWCKQYYCGYRGRCSETVGLVAASVPVLVDREPFRVSLTAAGFRSDEHAAWQYAALDAAEALLQEAREALKARARLRPIPLGDGRFYGEIEASNDTFRLDAPGFDAVLRKHLGEHASLVVETKKIAAKGRIEDAAREVAKAKKAAGEKATIKQIYAATLLDLRGIGGLKASPYKKLDTYTPKVAAPTPVPLAQVMGEIGAALEEHRQTG